MKSMLSWCLAAALTGCASAGRDGALPQAFKVADAGGAAAVAFAPLTEAQQAWMRAQITTTATNPAIPRPKDEAGGPLMLNGRPFDPALARAVESDGHAGTPEALIAGVVLPTVRSWAGDAVLANEYRFPFRGYYNGEVPISWRENEQVILKVFGWPLAYTSKSKLETLLVYVSKDKTLVVRVQRGAEAL